MMNFILQEINMKTYDNETSFLDWMKWRKIYKSCHPKKNPYTSPIDIFSSMAKRIKMQTLMIYSKVPEEDVYSFSTLYDNDNVQMESFSLRLRNDDVLREATYISGLGKDIERYFESALIMFRPGGDDEPLHERQSFHRINEKEYPMEIMFNFGTHLKQERIQIHVLVDIAEEENPAWKPILNTFEKLRQEIFARQCFGSERLSTAEQKLKIVTNIRKAAVSEQRNKTNGLTYKQIVTMLKDVLQSDAYKMLQKCQKESTSTDERMKSLERRMVFLKSKNDTPENETGLANINGQISELSKKKSSLYICIVEESNKINRTFKEDSSREAEFFKNTGIWNESKDLLRSLQDLSNLLEYMTKKQEELEEVEKLYEGELNEIERLKSLRKRSVLIKDPFQVSWLFPSNGGFYFYEGSSPVPPCKRKSYVMVLEEPITITEEQLNHFREFPSISNFTQAYKVCEIIMAQQGQYNSSDDKALIEALGEMNKIRSQVPPIKRLGNRTVWYNPKNIQFKDDDGLHMKSSTRRKLNNAQNSASKVKEQTRMIAVILIAFVTVAI